MRTIDDVSPIEPDVSAAHTQFDKEFAKGSQISNEKQAAQLIALDF